MENYEEAAVSRLQDWEKLSGSGRKAGAIHFGGIYIECVLKSIICSEYSVTDGRSGKWIVDGSEVIRPGHALTAGSYRNLLTDLYDDMPDDVTDSLEYLTSPELVSYIDYRYRKEDSVTEEVYDKWMEKFIVVFDYLDNKKHDL